jgi:hypothetical protein
MKTSGAMTGHETRAFRRPTVSGSRRFESGFCVRRTPRARHGACWPPPFPAGAAPVTRAAWVAGGLDAGAAFGRVPSVEAGSEAHGLVLLGFMSSPSTAVWRSERSSVSASPGFPAWLVSPVSPSGRFGRWWSGRLPQPPQRLTRRCSEPLRRVTPAAPTAFAPSRLSAAGAPRLRSR